MGQSLFSETKKQASSHISLAYPGFVLPNSEWTFDKREEATKFGINYLQMNKSVKPLVFFKTVAIT